MTNEFPAMQTIEILEKIGRMVIGTNGIYQTLVYTTIKETGKELEDLTVKELLEIDESCNKKFNVEWKPYYDRNS